MKIGIIGTGQIGGTLARRFTAIGHEVFTARHLTAPLGSPGSRIANPRLDVATLPRRAYGPQKRHSVLPPSGGYVWKWIRLTRRSYTRLCMTKGMRL